MSDLSAGLAQGTPVAALIGRNGAGKTTLCQVLAGVKSATSGDVMRDGAPVRTHKQFIEYRRRIGWCPQDLQVPRDFTVRQYLAYAAWLKKVRSSDWPSRLSMAVEATDVGALVDVKIGRLSGGMVRRTLIAASLVNDPRLLILDEPTVGLDPEQRDGFHTFLSHIKQDRAVLLSTHLMEDVAAVGDRVSIIDEGSAWFSGPVASLESRGEGHDRQERLRSAFIATLAGARAD